ncbi:MAG: hypothetical protein AWU54_2201, partial [Candidatus Frackibacter sp. T328-2]
MKFQNHRKKIQYIGTVVMFSL